MPKNYPEEVKLAALELFLDNKTGEQIATIVNQEFDLELKPPTIYAWAKKYDWKSENASMTTKAKEIVKEKQSQRIARLQNEHLDSYEKMRKKAESELELLDFERAFEAVKAMDIGIQGERKTMEGMVNLQFVQDVLSVLIEEITDPDIISKVANRLRRLVAERDDIE
tara:strand:+ start:596 stop:1099 length:504 start_codon:yes stop_codon:yes gene_type:complete